MSRAIDNSGNIATDLILCSKIFFAIVDISPSDLIYPSCIGVHVRLVGWEGPRSGGLQLLSRAKFFTAAARSRYNESWTSPSSIVRWLWVSVKKPLRIWTVGLSMRMTSPFLQKCLRLWWQGC